MTPVSDRLARLEASYRQKKARERARHTRPSSERFAVDMECSLQSIADALGVTRERARQIEAAALRKLGSEKHRREVEHDLDDAIATWKEAKASGNTKRMYWAIHNVDVLLDALQWLEELRNGTLRAHLVEAQQRPSEPTVYVGNVHYTDALIPAPSGKWKGRMVSPRGLP
jgi:hypothetical protein